HSHHDPLALVVLLLLFFFSSSRRHTRSDRDWSSDVCSSDLVSEMSGPKQAKQQNDPYREHLVSAQKAVGIRTARIVCSRQAPLLDLRLLNFSIIRKGH